MSLASSMPLPVYVRSAVGANGRIDTELYFPLLQIYDSAGRLVYVGHDANENAGILKRASEDAASMKAIPGTALLADITKQMADLGAQRDELLKMHKSTILSVSLEGCHACSVQDEALDQAEKQLLAQGINVLLLRVGRPG